MTKKRCSRRELKLTKVNKEKHTYAKQGERERLRYTTEEHYFIIQDEAHNIINFEEVYVGDGMVLFLIRTGESLKQPTHSTTKMNND